MIKYLCRLATLCRAKESICLESLLGHKNHKRITVCDLSPDLVLRSFLSAGWQKIKGLGPVFVFCFCGGGAAPTCLLWASLRSVPQWRTQWRTSATVGWRKDRRKHSSVIISCYKLSHRFLLQHFYFFTLWTSELNFQQSDRFQSSDAARSQIWEEKDQINMMMCYLKSQLCI